MKETEKEMQRGRERSEKVREKKTKTRKKSEKGRDGRPENGTLPSRREKRCTVLAGISVSNLRTANLVSPLLYPSRSLSRAREVKKKRVPSRRRNSSRENASIAG